MNKIMPFIFALIFAIAAKQTNADMPQDKVGHLVLGAGTYIGCRVLSYTPDQCFMAAVGVGLAKEAIDATDRKNHSVEFLDFAATAAGGGLLFTFERKF